jgi:hypothetical protein
MKCSPRLIISIIALALVVSSCRFSGFSAKYISNNAKQSRPVVFPQDFTKALYKTDLSIYGRPLTGITVIKKDTTGFHVALVSEVGLKYYELFFPIDPNQEPQVNYIMDVMNYPPVVKGLTTSFKLLFREPVYDKRAHLKMNETGKTCLLYNKDKQITTKYYFDWMSGNVEKIQQKNIIGTKTEIKLSNYETNTPGTILIHRGKLSIQLTRM